MGFRPQWVLRQEYEGFEEDHARSQSLAGHGLCIQVEARDGAIQDVDAV